MKLRTTALFKSWRDGKWYVIVRHGNIVESIELHDGEASAAEVIGRLFRMTPAMARKVVANPGVDVTFTPRAPKRSKAGAR